MFLFRNYQMMKHNLKLFFINYLFYLNRSEDIKILTSLYYHKYQIQLVILHDVKEFFHDYQFKILDLHSSKFILLILNYFIKLLQLIKFNHFHLYH